MVETCAVPVYAINWARRTPSILPLEATYEVVGPLVEILEMH